MKIIDSNDKYSRYIKPVLQKVVYFNSSHCRLMIMGCQRSGTTVLTKVFDDSFNCSVYGEYSSLSNNDKFKLRLNSPNQVIKTLNSDKAPLVVMKPLVESQNASYWLKNIPNSKVLWVLRKPEAVALSSLKKWGPMEGAINKIRPLVDTDFSHNPWTNWMTEHVKKEDVQLVKKHFHMDMNPADAAMLFWYIRNRHFFNQALNKRKDVLVVDYDQLTNKPIDAIERIKLFVGLPELRLSANYLRPNEKEIKLECCSAIREQCYELYGDFLSLGQ